MVTHILKDGTVLQDITGHIVKQSQAENLYTLIQTINNKIEKEREKS